MNVTRVNAQSYRLSWWRSGLTPFFCFGRPGLRIVDVKPKRLTAFDTQPSEPNGRQRLADARSASSSPSFNGVFTVRSQLRGRPRLIVVALPCLPGLPGAALRIGQGVSIAWESALPNFQRCKLDHCHASARLTSEARAALRST